MAKRGRGEQKICWGTCFCSTLRLLKFMKILNLFSWLELSFFFSFCPSLSLKKAISLSKEELIKQINQSVLLRNYKAQVEH